MSADLAIRAVEAEDADAVVALWRACGLVVPRNDPYDDFHRKRAYQPELFLVGLAGGHVVASVMGGWEGRRGWINYLAVAPDARGKGFGRAMVLHLEGLLEQLGCPKVNLQVRGANAGVLGFYRALGYAVEDVVSLGKRL